MTENLQNSNPSANPAPQNPAENPTPIITTEFLKGTETIDLCGSFSEKYGRKSRSKKR